jgi:ribonuclease H / adenosylcobalamin/alpha-ribazole phosphatase
VDDSAVVEARMDSKLVVEQMSGRWRIKHPDLQPLAAEARQAAAALGEVRYTWVPRASNAHADRLANEAMDGAPRPAAATPSPGQAPSSGRGAVGWRPVDDAPTRVVLLRHGETPLSAERRFAGTGDIELTATGHEQARAAGHRMAAQGIEAIASSPLRRARDTADHVAGLLGVEVETWPDFAEVDFGEWEGYTFQEVGERWPQDMQRWLADLNHAPPGGESMAAAGKRVAAAAERLLAAHRGRSVLVVSHVTPIKVVLRDALLAAPEALYRMHLDVGCVSEIDYFADGPAVVRAMNDTSHLGESQRRGRNGRV